MYSEITTNKRKTWILVTLFSCLVVALVTLFGASFGLEIEQAIIFGFGFSIIYSVIAFYFSDKAALIATGAKQIEKRDAAELYNIVENISITAGIPTPKIYVINDPVPNAFATGRDPNNASIAVTTGLLSILDKQELQGVIAHEISHIKNYDIRIMTIIVILVGLILLLSEISIRMVGFRKIRGKEGKAMILFIFISVLIFGILSPIIASVIKMSVSRTREYLADASGALLTRYPEGLANALKKIKTHAAPMKAANHATAHLFIANPFGSESAVKKGFFHKLFMTHPPIDDRIAKLTAMGK